MVEYFLPFEGRWFVAQAGDTLNVNHHMKEPSQWYGMDFMKVDGSGGRALSPSRLPAKPEDFHSWAQPVLSPVEGVVRQVTDGIPDNPFGVQDPKNAFGNGVILEAAPEEFVFLAHFKNGSLEVKSGDRVSPGQKLGLCGNSGNSTAPHIHMHVQETPIPYTGRGRNITFQHIDVELSGKIFSDVSWPLIRGLFVNASAC